MHQEIIFWPVLEALEACFFRQISVFLFIQTVWYRAHPVLSAGE